MRMEGKPGTKDYGALSLAVQYYSEPYIVANVPPNCFMPRPKVGSVVVSLKRTHRERLHSNSEKLLFEIIKAAFNQRRKTLANGLMNSQLNIPRPVSEEALKQISKDEMTRGEQLTLEDFISLTLAIEKRLA